MIGAGLIGTRGIIDLEVRYSARSHPDYESVAADRCPPRTITCLAR